MISIADRPQIGGMQSSSTKRRIKILPNEKFPADFFQTKTNHNLIFHKRLHQEDELFFTDLKNLPRAQQLIRSINHTKSRITGLSINNSNCKNESKTV
jgi:hypothetical protein